MAMKPSDFRIEGIVSANDSNNVSENPVKTSWNSFLKMT